MVTCIYSPLPHAWMRKYIQRALCHVFSQESILLSRDMRSSEKVEVYMHNARTGIILRTFISAQVIVQEAGVPLGHLANNLSLAV